MSLVSFASDISPMFTGGQALCMRNKGVDLIDYEYMSDGSGDSTFPDHANARHVLARLRGDPPGRRMPPGGPFWTDEMIETFSSWMDGGFLP